MAKKKLVEFRSIARQNGYASKRIKRISKLSWQKKYMHSSDIGNKPTD